MKTNTISFSFFSRTGVVHCRTVFVVLNTTNTEIRSIVYREVWGWGDYFLPTLR